MTTEKNYSEKMAQKIDDEVNVFIERAHAVAQKVLQTNKKALQKIAETLIEKETLEGDEFYNLLKPFKIKPIAV